MPAEVPLNSGRSESIADPGALQVSRIRPAYQQVADQLQSLILRGELPAGTRLPVEGELSAQFGVSRSTMREALRVLGSQGLINTVRGVAGGTFVSEADPESISDFLETRLGLLTGSEQITAEELLEARHLLEVPAARLAASRRTPQQLEAMREAIEQETQYGDRGQRFTHHHHFHSLLLQAAGNRLIDLMTVPIFRVIRARFLHDDTASVWREVDMDHREIFARIEAGDPEGAGAAMEGHLLRLRTLYANPEQS